MKMLFTLLLLLLTLSSSSFGADIIISSESDFTVFVSNINSESGYSGTTVYLDSDLSFSGKTLDPIGNETHQFRGVFDGKGHIISNLKMNSSLQYAGLFGYSNGLTIRNVVLDDSCTISNVFKSSGPSYVYTGGIIGRCESIYGECNIENSVNMASVTFSGSISNDLHLGGIIGELHSYFSSFNVYVKNCVNYGSVTDLGIVSTYCAELGGIVGYSYSSSSAYIYIQNCLNYGTITHNGTSTNLAIGGVVCLGYYTYIENCVSAGKIDTPTTATNKNFIGSVVGRAIPDIHVNYCYFTSDVNASSINGTGTPSSTTGTPNTPTDVDSRLVSKLNNNATSCNWNNWFMLHLNGGNINNLAQDILIGIQGQIPNPVKEGNNFLFWCKDAECNEKFDPATESASGITDLYAGWTPNNYTVTFDANGGNVSETSKIVSFNEKYGELPEPNRSGYMFLGWWLTNETDGTEVTNETTVTTAYNHTLYAHWEEVTDQVEIVFGTKDLTREDVEKIIEKYTEAAFTITEIENESGDIRVIIKFDDKEDAKEFTRNIKESDEAERTIKRIDFVHIVNIEESSESRSTIKISDFDQGNDGSFSIMAYPLSFFISLFI